MRRKEDLLIQIKYRENEKGNRENNKSKKVINTFKRNSDKIRRDSNSMYKRKIENLKLELSVSKKINRNLKREFDSPQLKSPQDQKYDQISAGLSSIDILIEILLFWKMSLLEEKKRAFKTKWNS